MRAKLLWLIPVLFIVSGCGLFSRPADFSAPLLQWLSQQRFSSWEATRQGARASRRFDGLTLGNRHIFAGVGCSPRDLTQLDPLYGDHKSARAFSSPISFAIQTRGQAVPLADFDRQRLRRVAGSSIAVTESTTRRLTVTTIDFAPLNPELNCLVRLIIVTNWGRRGKFALSLAGLTGDWKQQQRDLIADEGRVSIYCDHQLRLTSGEYQAQVELGAISRGESRSVALYFVPGRDPQQVTEDVAAIRKALAQDPTAPLRATLAAWHSWRDKVKVDSGSARLDDLIDSLLCLVKSHIGFDAIHTGSLRYPHTRAWVRDNYWVQRALLEAGLVEEAKLNLEFFFAAWQESGICSYYDIATRKGEPYGNIHVELPQYLVLMVKDADKLGKIDPPRYWPMVKDCLDQAGVVDGGLQPINGDETWLLAANVDQVAYSLDNTWLLMAAAEYGAELAKRVGDAPSAARYAALAQASRQAAEKWFASKRFVAKFAPAGSGETLEHRWVDEFPVAGVIARPVIFGLYPAKDERIFNGLGEALGSLAYEGGIRSYSRSGVVDGGTPGYFLYAAAEAGLGQCNSLVQRLMEGFISDTGSVWELQSVTEPSWGLEKRRLWDSAVLLLGLLHYSKLRASLPPSPGESFYYAAGLAAIPPPGLQFPRSPLSALLYGRDEAFIDQSIILEKDSPAQARELATQLARHYGAPIQVGPWTGQIPTDANVFIISPTQPALPPGEAKLSSRCPNVVTATAGETREYLRRAIVWVKSGSGDVFADLADVEYELFRSAVPRRSPAPYPDSDLEIAPKIGEPPRGLVEVKVAAENPTRISCAGKVVEAPRAAFVQDLAQPVTPQSGALQINLTGGADRLVTLAVFARGGTKTRARVEVVFPPGFWVVEARGLQGNWDRTADPIDEVHRPDGRRAFVFNVHLGQTTEKSFTLRLCRPAIIPFAAIPAPPRQ